MPDSRIFNITAFAKDDIVGWVNNGGKDIHAASNPDPTMAKMFGTRDARKALLQKLGVDENTRDDYRLVWYFDGIQSVMFRAQANENGTITLSDSMVIGEGIAPLNPGMLEQGAFKALPKPIELPPPAKDAKGRIDLTTEEKKKVSAEVTLLALAERATEHSVAVAGSAAGLPRITGRGTGVTV